MNRQRSSEIARQCHQFLHGHYPRNPSDYFREMAGVVSPALGQDHYGVGSALQSFERELCEILGHEDGLFMQSGTMAQLIAMRIWTEKSKNSSIGFHPTCHLELHEKNAYRELHNLKSILIGEKDRLITIEDLKSLEPLPAAVIFELPQREIGGQLPAWDQLTEQISFLRAQGVYIHLDGARIWECSSFYNKSYSEIAGLFDSVYVSFYKGIGAVAGAALLGSSQFIEEARIWNRRHGGNLITAFPMYLSAEKNLKERIGLFESYYEKAVEIALKISGIPGVEIIPKVPQTNMFHVMIEGDKTSLLEKSLDISEKTKTWGFQHLQESDRKGWCKLEWYVGDATMDVSTGFIYEFVRQLSSR